MRLGWNPRDASQRILRLAIILYLLWILVYIVIYWYQPFSEFLNNFFANFFTQVASFLAATFATMIWLKYDKTDAPRRIWGPFAIALWMWFAGELTWGYLNMTTDEVPIGLPDLFWVTSYALLGLALIQQSRILLQPERRDLWMRILIAALVLIGLTYGIYRFLTSAAAAPQDLGAIVNSFYPAADLLMAVIVLWLARNFIGGAFSRPWMGLLAFTFSDLMYAWLETSGMYAWSLEQGNLLSTIADVAYFGSYLVLGLCVLYQWLFLKYGLRSMTDAR